TPQPLPHPETAHAGSFVRKKTSLWFTVSLLVVSVFILTIGLAATTRTENVTVGGYYPGIVVTLLNLFFSSQLVASIVFISFGVVAAFCCAIVDGVFAARHIEPRPLYNKRCQFYSSGIGFLYDAYQTEVNKLTSSCVHCCYALRGWGGGRHVFESMSVHVGHGLIETRLFFLPQVTPRLSKPLVIASHYNQ
uniref:Transmembrane protein 255B n=1 Tax=Buteo japonicus TaxID=224669 RepID=A0A8C0C3N7_9AVES